MDVLIQFIVNAASVGGVYALLALGIAVVFSVLGFFNFAHGDLLTICAYALFFGLGAGLPFPLAAVCGIGAAMAAAVLMERIAFRPLRQASPMVLLVTSFALSGALHVCFQIFISPRPQPIPVPEILNGAIQVGGAFIGIVQLTAILVTALSLTALSLFLTRTDLGIGLRAAAQDFQATRLMGMRADALIAGAFAISGALAAVAGLLLVAQRGGVDPTMGAAPLIKAFVAAIIGGLGRLTGPVVGGFVLGAVEVLIQALLPQDFMVYRDSLVLALLILCLIARPNGLTGARDEPMRLGRARFPFSFLKRGQHA